MKTIEYLRASRTADLVRSEENQSWLNTPKWAAGRAGSGPGGETCGSCRYFDRSRLCWSNEGQAAPCSERERLAIGTGKIGEVPAKMPSCSLFAEHPDAPAASAFADQQLAQKLTEKREKIERWRQAIDRETREIRELELARHEGKAEPLDPAWKGFEPAAPYDTS
jgi:hypothetical protein